MPLIAAENINPQPITSTQTPCLTSNQGPLQYNLNRPVRKANSNIAAYSKRKRQREPNATHPCVEINDAKQKELITKLPQPPDGEVILYVYEESLGQWLLGLSYEIRDEMGISFVLNEKEKYYVQLYDRQKYDNFLQKYAKLANQGPVISDLEQQAEKGEPQTKKQKISRQPTLKQNMDAATLHAQQKPVQHSLNMEPGSTSSLGIFANTNIENPKIQSTEMTKNNQTMKVSHFDQSIDQLTLYEDDSNWLVPNVNDDGNIELTWSGPGSPLNLFDDQQEEKEATISTDAKKNTI